MKLGLLASTCGYVYLVRVMTKDPFLSVALFELLHDIQYMAIVWAFNRRQVDKGGGNVIMRFLYRPSLGSVAFYVGACLLYGGFAFAVFTKVENGMVKSVLEAFLITSGLLHFYYDGFIWKLRQSGTQSGLGLDQKNQKTTAYRPPLWRGASHVAIMIILALMPARFELNSRDMEPLEKAQAIADAVPDNPTSLNNLGLLLMERGDYEQAVPLLRRAVKIQPDLIQARVSLSDSLAMLSVSYLERGLIQDAIALRREALEIEPDSVERLNDLSVLLAQAGKLDEAEVLLRKAVSLDPNHEYARGNLEVLLEMR
jgi:tetratricopeptide (TPR) repeat protein